MKTARRLVLVVLWIASLVGVAAVAQVPATEPSFEISIVAPGGMTTVTCVRGCVFKVTQQQGGTTTAATITSFSQGCPDKTCETKVAGLIAR